MFNPNPFMSEDHIASLLAEAEQDRLATHARLFRTSQPARPSRFSTIVAAVRRGLASPVAAATDDVVPTLRDYPMSHSRASV